MFKSEIKILLEKPTWKIFILSWFFYLTGLILFGHYVWSEDIYGYNQNTGKDFNNYIDFIRKIDTVRYFLSPVYLAGVASVIWLILQIGLTGLKKSIEKKLLFKIILLGLIILSLQFWIKTVYFVLIQGNYSPDEVKYFYPLSILHFFNPEHLNLKIVKALGRLNLYHITFMIFITWGIKLYTSVSFGRLFTIVLATYGMGFLLLQMVVILIFI